MQKRKFLRTNTRLYKRLGKSRKKLRKWRRPRGRHNKLREKIRGKPARPVIGFKKPEKTKIKIEIISNLKELEALSKGEKIIIGSIGRKNKVKLREKAKEKGLEVVN